MIKVKGINFLKIIFFSQTILIILVSFAIAKKDECDGPSKSVKVTVKEVSASPPTYLYTVTNLGQSPIINISLGSTDHNKMRKLPDNIPEKVDSPQGWEGEHIFIYESQYMHIFWGVKDNTFEIKPGNSLTGFKLVMPKPVKRDKP